MRKGIDIDQFIKDHITLRQESLFKADLEQYDEELNRRIAGKSVMVIGGAGTIGSFFIKAILKYKPRKLYVIDINENGLTELVRDLRSTAGGIIPETFLPYPINFSDTVFQKIWQKEGPFDIVANFAAHKHVRSEKDHYSIEAMVENNVLKAKALLDLLLENPPQRFFCVSTDKAANPVNVMGASKKLMEEVILAYSGEMPITTARFANVAFSNGSLLAGFLERLKKRQPFSSPLNIQRYFVSPQEAGELCLIACMLGDSGDIFFPKLKEEQMMTFSSIADQLLMELGYEPFRCSTEEEARYKATNLTADSAIYPVYYFPSNTSGEKAYEEFYTHDELLDWYSFNSLGVIKNNLAKPISEIENMFVKLKSLFQEPELEKASIIKCMQEFLPNFEHIETGKGLDEKM